MAHPAQQTVVMTAPYAGGAWTYGVCACMEDCGICCDVFWCGCCVVGSTCEAINHSKPNTQNYLIGCVTFLGTALSWWVLGAPCVQVPFCCLVLSQRHHLREKYGIVGNGCDDCCCAWCCGACVLCQIYRESAKRGVQPAHCCCAPSRQYTPATVAVVAQPAYPVAQPDAKQQGIYPQQGAQHGGGYPAPQQGGYPPQQAAYPAPQQGAPMHPQPSAPEQV